MDSESIRSAMCLYVQPTQARSPICQRSPINVYNGERNKNGSSQFCMAAISRLTSAFLLWVLWLSGMTIRVVIRRSPVRLPTASLWTFLLSKVYIITLYTEKPVKLVKCEYSTKIQVRLQNIAELERRTKEL